jgi:hypothetical protein
MTVTQTVEIPASRRLTIDVPREIPLGRTILTFTPAIEQKAAAEDGLGYEGECPICAAHDYMPNAETIAAIEEGRAMMRGEIPALRFHSFEEMVADLERYDPDEDD